MEEEIIWNPIRNFEDLYLISNNGMVRSLEKMIRGRIFGYYSHRDEKILTPGLNSYGYHFYVLSRDKQKKTRLEHQLVADAFIGICPEGYQVNHINGIKLDNRVENLEYVTPLENTLHSINVLGNRRDGEYH